MDSRGISCWSVDESPPSATKGGNLAAFIPITDLALDRSLACGDALFRKLTMCDDGDDDDMTNAASSLHLFLLLSRTAVVVSERGAKSMHQKSDRSGISLLYALTYEVRKVVEVSHPSLPSSTCV